MKKFIDFYEAWWYLNKTEVFINPEIEDLCRGYDNNSFHESLEVYVAKVNPETCEVDEDDSKNIKVEVWLECGEFLWDTYMHPEGKWVSSHNIDYDCGGDTFEEAIINLANIVWDKNKK